jgi:hypothetical protein
VQKVTLLRYVFETYTPSLSSSSASTLYKPPRKQRSHALDFYESYTPSGLLRHNWLSKHQNDVPSVAALVFDTLDPRQLHLLIGQSMRQQQLEPMLN